jgi:HAD superfamily hydrolase (TIGR01509 family)
MGVIYERGGVSGLLAEYARRCGSTATDDGFREVYRRATRGELGSAGVWEALGIADGSPERRDAEFLDGRALMPDVRSFLAAMRGEGVPVGCITNDVAEWSVRLRRAHRLEAEIAPWVVSAEVGVRKPGAAIYERFLAEAGCEAGECLFVDDLVENLDAARRLGFRTAWFQRRFLAAGHPRVGSFDELGDLIFGQRASSVG